jgi:hypothetical protein
MWQCRSQHYIFHANCSTDLSQRAPSTLTLYHTSTALIAPSFRCLLLLQKTAHCKSVSRSLNVRRIKSRFTFSLCWSLVLGVEETSAAAWASSLRSLNISFSDDSIGMVFMSEACTCRCLYWTFSVYSPVLPTPPQISLQKETWLAVDAHELII